MENSATIEQRKGIPRQYEIPYFELKVTYQTPNGEETLAVPISEQAYKKLKESVLQDCLDVFGSLLEEHPSNLTLDEYIQGIVNGRAGKALQQVIQKSVERGLGENYNSSKSGK